MSVVISKSRCPQCAKTGHDKSGNNLAEYDDGHLYCFRCGFYQPGTLSKRIHHGIVRSETPAEVSDIAMPADSSIATTGEGFHWLAKYGITTSEILSNRILWSEQSKLLIFPLVEGREVVGWQARNFNPSKPYKYITKGKVKESYFSFGNSRTCVLVEDIVSAIKVSRSGVCAVPILGSVISIQTIARLKHLHDNFIVWLDPDKSKEAIAYSSKIRSLGIPCITILSDKDPKDYDDNYIRQTVSGRNTS